MPTTPNYPMTSRASCFQKVTQIGGSAPKRDRLHHKYPEETQEDIFAAAFQRKKPLCKKCFSEDKGRSYLPQRVPLQNHL